MGNGLSWVEVVQAVGWVGQWVGLGKDGGVGWDELSWVGVGNGLGWVGLGWVGLR